MQVIHKGIIAASFAAVMGSHAMAEESAPLKTAAMKAISVVGNTNRNYQTYYMEEEVNSNRSAVRGRAFVDKAIGVTCEWLEHGRREPDMKDKNLKFHTVDVKSERLGCVPSTTLPKAWASAKEHVVISGINLTSEIFMMGVDPQFEKKQQDVVGEVNSKQTAINQLKETVSPDNAHGIAGMRITHTWDLSANRVCLQTVEVTPEAGAYAQSWGCFPITNQNYFDRVLKQAGITPS